MERQIERRASKTASRPAILWRTDGGWDMGAELALRERQAALLFLPPLLPSLAVFAALRGTSIDIACLRVRVILDAWDTLVPAGTRHQRLLGKEWGPGIGKRAKAGRSGLLELLDVVCCYLPSQLHACLLCLTLPCLVFLFSFYLFFFIDAPGGRMEGWPSSFHVLQLVHLLLPRPQTLEKASSGGVVQSVSQEETTAAGFAFRH